MHNTIREYIYIHSKQKAPDVSQSFFFFFYSFLSTGLIFFFFFLSSLLKLVVWHVLRLSSDFFLLFFLLLFRCLDCLLCIMCRQPHFLTWYFFFSILDDGFNICLFLLLKCIIGIEVKSVDSFVWNLSVFQEFFDLSSPQKWNLKKGTFFCLHESKNGFHIKNIKNIYCYELRRSRRMSSIFRGLCLQTFFTF